MLFKDLELFEIKEGEGSFGQVHRAFDKSSRKTVALKKIKKDDIISKKEIEIMKILKNKNHVTQIISEIPEEDSIFIKMTYAESNLFEILKKRSSENDYYEI